MNNFTVKLLRQVRGARKKNQESRALHNLNAWNRLLRHTAVKNSTELRLYKDTGTAGSLAQVLLQGYHKISKACCKAHSLTYNKFISLMEMFSQTAVNINFH